MDTYYADQLSAERLKRCYELAPPRVKSYLEAEISYVIERIQPSDAVLELGCGYGRVLQRIAEKARFVAGIDNSSASLSMARNTLVHLSSCHLVQMDAGRPGFKDKTFDVVVCIQNGVSAFKVDPKTLFSESLRLILPGGKALFSSYSPKFWSDRLEWFRLQAAEGQIGEIDEEATGSGVIVCKDGFRATTFGIADFKSTAESLGLFFRIEEVDESSLFCELRP
jgi:SAM-dependent methyltransferase